MLEIKMKCECESKRFEYQHLIYPGFIWITQHKLYIYNSIDYFIYRRIYVAGWPLQTSSFLLPCLSALFSSSFTSIVSVALTTSFSLTTFLSLSRCSFRSRSFSRSLNWNSEERSMLNRSENTFFFIYTYNFYLTYESDLEDRSGLVNIGETLSWIKDNILL